MNILQVRNRLLSMWPGLRHIWPWDRSYDPIEEDELREVTEIVHQTKITFPDGTEIIFRDLRNIGDVWDCDDFACGAEFLTKLWFKVCAEKGGLHIVPKAYGQARGIQFRGIQGPHALNIALGKEEIYFNDHDAGGRSWKANSENDILFYVSL